MSVVLSKIAEDDLQFVYEDIEEKLRYIIKKSGIIKNPKLINDVLIEFF